VRLIVLALVGCGAGAPAPAPEPPAAPQGPVTLVLDTAPGLSGLAVADDGALWTVAERDGAAYRIVVVDDRVASVTRFPLDPAPPADLEAIEVLGAGAFTFGLEANAADGAGIALGRLADDGASISVTRTLPLPATTTRVLEPNKGVEGVCGSSTAVLLAFETVVEADGARFGQVEVHRDGTPPQEHRVRLTSATGKLSSIDCRPAPDATSVDVLAIERHFEVTRIVSFAIELTAAGPSTVDATVVRDLAELAAGRNFEGIARLPDGRVALVTDNQWKTIDGPSQLVLLPAGP
jgi:hypothetical protein